MLSKSFVLIALGSVLAGSVQASSPLGAVPVPIPGANALAAPAEAAVGHVLPLPMRRNGLAHRRAAGLAKSKAKAKSRRQDRGRCKERDESPSGASPAEDVASTSSSVQAPQPTTASLSQANAVAGVINVQSTCGDIGATSAF